jgi:Holliday junction resolvase RusA-like endonuclease
MIIWKGTIIGHMPRKSNQRRIIFKQGKPLNIKSKEAIDWNNHAILQLKAARKHPEPHQSDTKLTAHIYYRSNKSDLSDELLCDAFEKAGIIQNDRQIVEKHLYRYKDKDNPRVEVMLESL